MGVGRVKGGCIVSYSVLFGNVLLVSGAVRPCLYLGMVALRV